MASEDSDQLGSGLLAVHRLRDLDDADEPFWTQMLAGIDQAYAPRKLLEVLRLRRAQHMPLEEGDDRPKQVFAPANHVPMQMLPVVIAPAVHKNLSDAEELTELLETPDALRALRHDEFVEHLVAGPVAASAPAA